MMGTDIHKERLVVHALSRSGQNESHDGNGYVYERLLIQDISKKYQEGDKIVKKVTMGTNINKERLVMQAPSKKYLVLISMKRS
jgi:hypothetical protein